MLTRTQRGEHRISHTVVTSFSCQRGEIREAEKQCEFLLGGHWTLRKWGWAMGSLCAFALSLWHLLPYVISAALKPLSLYS